MFFKTSASDDAALHIRRVIGLPGETVRDKKKARSTLMEMFTKRMVLIREIADGGLADSAITLESGEYFVLGDNRNNSGGQPFQRYWKYQQEIY